MDDVKDDDVLNMGWKLTYIPLFSQAGTASRNPK
jgi:hypothetical protein